jgi:hypothetical protein
LSIDQLPRNSSRRLMSRNIGLGFVVAIAG